MTTANDQVELLLRPRTVWRICGQIALLVAGVYLLSRIAFALGWALIALVLALALEPAIVWLERHRLRRGWAIFLVMGGIVAFLGALAATLVPVLIEQVQGLVGALPGYVDRVRASEELAWANVHLGLLDAMKRELAGAASTVAGSAVAFASTIFYGVAGTVTVIVLTIFMLLFGPALTRALLEWVRPTKRTQIVEVAMQIQKSVGGFVAGSLVVASIGGVVTATAMVIVGVPYYVALGLSMVILGLIPYIGSFIGAVLVTVTAFFSAGVTPAITMAAVVAIYQQIENQLLQPLVQRQTIKMNPLLITLAMLVGTASAGIIGAVLALPVAGALQVIAQRMLARRKASWEHEASEAHPTTETVTSAHLTVGEPRPATS